MSQFDRLLGLVRPTSGARRTGRCNRGAVMLTEEDPDFDLCTSGHYEALRKLMQEVEVEEAHDRI